MIGTKVIAFQSDFIIDKKITEAMRLLKTTNKSKVIRYALLEGLEVIIERHRKDDGKGK